jgi:hemoglobin-like flavoprotein
MSLDVQLIRTNFEYVIEREPNLTERFYDVLFERYPQVQPLFGRNSRAAQQQMLAQALMAVIDHLEDAPWLEQTLGALGRRHVDYGVTQEMYGWVGDALLTVLERASGDTWTTAHRDNWTLAYSAIVSLMCGEAGVAAA